MQGSSKWLWIVCEGPPTSQSEEEDFSSACWGSSISAEQEIKSSTLNRRAVCAILEGPSAKSTKVPTGTQHRLQRTALKDIKNDPSLSYGPHGPVASWKGQLSGSEGESSFVQRPRVRKGGVHFEDEVRPSGGQNITNNPQTSVNRLPVSPKGYSSSKGSFFSDPTTIFENKGSECAEVTLNCTNKYFSTPLIPKGRSKKKLSPVMEVDTESNTVQECSKEKLTHNTGATLYESSLEIPLYRSFFAMECQEIAEKIKGSENDCRSPGKRKAEELDVSSIDAEPPPYDCTPMKSLLVWEVSNMLSSLENSPVKNEGSLFGESLLDLERTDMQLQDFNLSDVCNKNSKRQSENNSVVEGMVYSTDGECCIKRQKMSPLSFDQADTFHQESVNDSTANFTAASGTRQNLTSPRERRITLSTSQTEEQGVCNLTGELENDGANTLHVCHVPEGIALHCPARVTEEDVNKLCASTTQDIDELANTTRDIELAPLRFPMLNATEEMELFSQSVCNITQEISLVTKDSGIVNTTIEIKAEQTGTNVTQHTVSNLCATHSTASTTWVAEEESPTSVATVKEVASLDVRESLANTTQVIIPQPAADTTQDIVSLHESSITNTTQVIEVVPHHSPNRTDEMLPVHETSRSANTTQVIKPVPGDSLNATQDIVVQDEGKAKDTIKATMTIGATDTKVTAELPNPANKLKVCDGSTEDIGFQLNSKFVNVAIMHKAFSPAVPHIVPKDISTTGSAFSTTNNSVEHAMQSPEEVKDLVSPKAVQTSVPTFDVVSENQKLSESTKASCDFSGCSLSPEKEVMIPNKDDTNVASAEDQTPVSDVTHANAGQGTLVSTSTQSKPDSQDHSGNKEGNDIKDCAFGTSPTVSPSKEPKNHLLASESCSMIQEEENVHDVSVFSAGSLSFVTSTPLAGLSTFQFQKSCKDPEQQDPNTSLGCVIEPPQKKDQTEDCKTQSKLIASTGGNEGHKHNQGLSRLPTNVQRTMVPHQMSGISTARRSLALFPNPTGQSLVKEPMLTKIPAKGIPGKGSMKPPVARQSLPRASMGNLKQNFEAKVGTTAPSKIAGSSFRTPKVATAKPRPAALPPPFPSGPPLGDSLSQMSVTSRGGSAGTPNVTNELQDPASVVHTAPSTGFKSFLPKPGSSSNLHPLPLSSQKTFLKPKSNLTGLPGRKTQRELTALGSQKKTVPVKGGVPVKRQLKPPSSVTQAAPTDAIPKAAAKSNIPPNRTEQIKSEPSERPLPPPAPLPEMAESSRCPHVETCECCHQLYLQIQHLLQENEDLRRQLDQVEHGNEG